MLHLWTIYQHFPKNSPVISSYDRSIYIHEAEIIFPSLPTGLVAWLGAWRRAARAVQRCPDRLTSNASDPCLRSRTCRDLTAIFHSYGSHGLWKKGDEHISKWWFSCQKWWFSGISCTCHRRFRGNVREISWKIPISHRNYPIHNFINIRSGLERPPPKV